MNLMGLKSNSQDLSFFRALTLLVGSFDPSKPVSDMTYNVFDGTLNLALSIYLVTCQALPTTAFMRYSHLRSVRKSYDIMHSIEHQAKMVKMSKLLWLMVSYKFNK